MHALKRQKISDENVDPLAVVPDEEMPAPTQSAGAHSKPLSALFGASKSQNIRRKTDATTEETSGFEATLAKIQSEVAAESDQQVWERPALTPVNSETDTIIFQQIDIEEFSIPGQRPQIRAFGITEAGHSVLIHVHGYLPYFYVGVPRNFSNGDREPFKKYLNSSFPPDSVLSVEIQEKQSLWGYKGDHLSPFLKITTSDNKIYTKIRSAFERGDIRFKDSFDNSQLMTFDSNVAFPLKFMIDHKITGMNWLEIPPRTYTLRDSHSAISLCQIELDVDANALVSHEPVGEWSKIAPLRVLSFDIECAGRKGIFPEPEKDPVIQIASMVTRQGETRPFIRNIFTLNTCAHIVGTDVRSFETEGEMLQAWRDFVVAADPDLLIGYNTSQFDFPYLMDRARALKVAGFPYLGRLRNRKTEVRDTHFSSKAYGTRDSKETTIEGRLQLDILQVMQRDYKLRSYTLNSVCAHFLGEQKEDVHHSIITDLQNGSPESRRRLAVYCLKDAYLPQRIMDKLMCFINYVELARVTGIPFNFVTSRGQQIRVVSQLHRKARELGYLIPSLRTDNSDDQYEGATVIEPSRGYYDVPIATLDFASLYPSIMMAHNLCYTTLLDAKIVATLGLVKDEDYIVTPNNDLFVTKARRKGILPIILEDLLSARKAAKRDLKAETDPFRRAVLDGRQLALKISANSVYGFTGATVGKLPCLPISMSVTAFGREMIERTKQEVQARYTRANGYAGDATVIYGDTDSVMVRFGCRDLETAMALGAEAAEYVSTKFAAPIRLEFEKVYFPYLLISKKRYAGLYWTRADHWDKMDTKGIETVRRDNCRLVVNVVETCLRKMLIERDVTGAENYVKKIIADLLQNRVDLSQLVITKALAKADYAAKQAHVELAERMRKRDAGSAPTLGDRVAYVIIKGPKDARAYEKSEDPLYVLEHNIPIDTKYYLENQLSKPLMRIFEPILGDKANSLLAGDHTRTVSIIAPTVGGLMKFAVKTLTCLGCKTPIKQTAVSPTTNTAVCYNCRERTPELYTKYLNQATAHEIEFSRLWTQCQRCQGSLHQDVLCSSKDCPIFYMRKKVQKDAEESIAVLDRFEGTW